MTSNPFDRVRELVEQDTPVVMATVIRGEGIGKRMIVLPEGTEGTLGDASFDRGVAELTRLGFEPTWDDSVFASESAYLAGSGDVRASAFLKHWNDPSVSALIAVRGGYGSVHMLPLLHPPQLPLVTKPCPDDADGNE